MFHLRRQNAGLLVTARQDDILFEAFELLAPNEHVMSCQGAPLRDLPDRAAVVALDKVREDDFLDVLADTIQKLDVGIAPVARPKVSKAGTTQPEERDTVSPILVTGMLIDVLVGMGRSVDPDRRRESSRRAPPLPPKTAALPKHDILNDPGSKELWEKRLVKKVSVDDRGELQGMFADVLSLLSFARAD